MLMSRAKSTLSIEKIMTRYICSGHTRHVLTCPITDDNLLEVITLIKDDSGVTLSDKLTASVAKAHNVKAFANFNTTKEPL